jgi:tetratricopeptide (TPR) repeat protein
MWKKNALNKGVPTSTEQLGSNARDSGDAARDRKDWKTAIGYYEKYLSSNPDDLQITIQLGHAYKESGDYARAYDCYTKVVERLPENDDIHLQMGHLEKLRGNIRVASEHYKTAMNLSVKNTDARLEYEAIVRNQHGILPRQNSSSVLVKPAWSPSYLPNDFANGGFAARVREIEGCLSGPK